ncbi:hypothetical protein ACG02S_25495 [Roseateles sp. DC23W]|uniref:Uncharacterized protein n=1 Tax=Pelomonas dachongensis TaxID=3299029 RepID=A0ABW7EUU4_9BURK
MNVDLAIRGALASLPDTFNHAQFIQALALHDMTAQDAGLALERAVMEGYVARAPSSVLSKLPKAAVVAATGHLPQP